MQYVAMGAFQRQLVHNVYGYCMVWGKKALQHLWIRTISVPTAEANGTFYHYVAAIYLFNNTGWLGK